MYAVGLSRLFTEGPEGPTNYFLSLAEVNEAIEVGEYYRSDPAPLHNAQELRDTCGLHIIDASKPIERGLLDSTPDL